MKKRILCLLVCAVMLMSVAALAAFAEEPAALGAVCSADKTVFGYQNAEATAVSVKVYATLNDTDEGAAELGTYPMTAGENGIWSVTVDGDLNGRYYTYVYTAGADPVEIPDPQNTVEGAVRSQIKAAVQYDLWVAGIQVTSGNAQDVLGAADEGATVLFNGETNTLTLAAGANITGEGAGIVYSGTEKLTIHLLGSASVSGKTGAMDLTGEVVLTAAETAALSVSALESGHGVTVGSKLTVGSNVSLRPVGMGEGKAGLYVGENAALVIEDGGNVTAQGVSADVLLADSAAPIPLEYFISGKLKLANHKLAGAATFGSDGARYTMAGSIMNGTGLVISAATPSHSYWLTDSVSGIGYGCAIFVTDGQNHTLILFDVMINNAQGAGIDAGDMAITLQLRGANDVTGNAEKTEETTPTDPGAEGTPEGGTESTPETGETPETEPDSTPEVVTEESGTTTDTETENPPESETDDTTDTETDDTTDTETDDPTDTEPETPALEANTTFGIKAGSITVTGIHGKLSTNGISGVLVIKEGSLEIAGNGAIFASGAPDFSQYSGEYTAVAGAVPEAMEPYNPDTAGTYVYFKLTSVNGHTLGTWNEGVATTCMAAGKLGYHLCATCQKNVDADGLEIVSVALPADPDAHYFDKFESHDNKHTKTCAHNSAHVVTEACSGGEATCTTPARCALCGSRYGRPLYHEYYGIFTHQSELGHWQLCQRPGCGMAEEPKAHTGGVASCTEPYRCTVCSFVYAEPAGHSYTTTPSDQLVSEATCASPAMYLVKCDRCDSVHETMTVPGGDPLPHVFEGQLFSNMEGHWGICTVCGKNDAAERHVRKTVNQKAPTAKEAGYTGDVICEVCGFEILKGWDMPATGNLNGQFNWVFVLFVVMLVASGLGLGVFIFIGIKNKQNSAE